MSSISVFGLGYVGSVLVACFADNGHQVIGVDVSPTKVNLVNEGKSPVIEEGMNELMAKGVKSGRIHACMDAAAAVHETDVSLVCVGTPSYSNGSLNMSYVQRVCEEIGRGLKTKDGYHTVVLRSTMLPGGSHEIAIPALEESSGKKAGVDFGVCFNPEFLREGSSIADFYNPPYTVIGADDDRSAEVVKDLYKMVDAEVIVTPIKVAEMVKYVNNTFHALKVTFANEIGDICKQQNIDSHVVMDIFTKDTKLNLSPYYLKPGFAFGGSCLPKDLRALLYHSRHLDVHLPVLEAILPSNRRQIDLAYQMIRKTGSKQVGVLGFSFKAGTDDLRESPVVELIERLIGKGYSVKVFDHNVSLANLQGANRSYIEQEIPHISSLMSSSIEEVMDSSEVVVIGNKGKGFDEALKRVRDGQTIIDLVRIVDDTTSLNGHYQGICW